MSNSCVFCRIISGSLPCDIIRNDEHVLTIRDINPKAPVHFLIMPKMHVRDMGDAAIKDAGLAQPLFDTVWHLAQEHASGNAFNIVSNNGAQAGQTVFHFHWHFLAGSNIYEGGLTL